VIVPLLLLAFASTAEAPFHGHWICKSAFQSEPYSLELGVDGEQTTAEISNSNDAMLPDGPIKLWGGPQEVKHYGNDRNNIYPERRWDAQVDNAKGNLSFSMLWDWKDGLSVNLRQYFADGSPSKFVGALKCEEKSA
jgi:hypothetical protein